jgi:hypothetical protein
MDIVPPVYDHTGVAVGQVIAALAKLVKSRPIDPPKKSATNSKIGDAYDLRRLLFFIRRNMMIY